MKTLYLCYFGIREPLVQTQVLPYLSYLAGKGLEIHLLTFESKAWTYPAPKRRDIETGLAAEGIRWQALRYHKNPSVPATLYDILVGSWTAYRLVRREKIEALHARSHVPMAMALIVHPFARCRLVFDVRGLLADEYVAAGRWKEGSAAVRAMRALERWGIQKADAVIVLTQQAKAWLIEKKLKQAGQITVIPCCIDTAAVGEGSVAPATRFEVVYAGSTSGLYLVEEMARFVRLLTEARPGVFFRVLTKDAPEVVAPALKRAGLLDSQFSVSYAAPEAVPGLLKQASLGLSFRRMSFAQIAASPTKITEYLACGIPVVCNAGVGDMDDVLEKESVGVVARSLDEPALKQAAEQTLVLMSDSGLRQRCQAVAARLFDLEQVGGPRYYSVYQQLGLKEQ